MPNHPQHKHKHMNNKQNLQVYHNLIFEIPLKYVNDLDSNKVSIHYIKTE